MYMGLPTNGQLGVEGSPFSASSRHKLLSQPLWDASMAAGTGSGSSGSSGNSSNSGNRGVSSGSGSGSSGSSVVQADCHRHSHSSWLIELAARCVGYVGADLQVRTRCMCVCVCVCERSGERRVGEESV